MSNLYQDAILDAKALRASAIANAKSALEEAFGPKIEAIVRESLAEKVEETEQVEEGWGEEEGMKHEEGKMHGEPEMEESVDINEAELDEILNQLEELESPKEEATLKEAAEEEEEEGEEEEGEEEEGEEEEGEEEGAEAEEEPTDETKVIDITLGDLKQVIQSLMPAPAPEPEAPTADSEAEEEVSLEEILDELEAESIEEDMEEEGAEKIGRYNAQDANDTDPQGTEQGFGGRFEAKKKSKDKEPIGDKYPSGKKGAALSASKKGTGYNQELEEAKSTIETLRKDLQEVNLLNAKYLYMNKLFKSNSLSESQKVKVINALDRATNVKEVKLVFESLSESFAKKKDLVRESVGFASKPAGVAPKANIVEADQFISRWQKLAGIK